MLKQISSWGKVLLFAAVTGIYTGLIMLPSFLAETSFQDIGISYEWWVFFAVLVVLGGKKPWDAALKCFVFFLVSQPLIYLVEIAFGTLTWDLAKHYYLDLWLPATLLTLPGGLIAYFCQKQTLLGAVILGLGNTIEAVMGVMYFLRAYYHFPHHLLSALSCLGLIGLMTFAIQKKAVHRIVALVVPLVLTFALVLYAQRNGLSLY